jgi:hypothetical protein
MLFLGGGVVVMGRRGKSWVVGEKRRQKKAMLETMTDVFRFAFGSTKSPEVGWLPRFSRNFNSQFFLPHWLWMTFVTAFSTTLTIINSKKVAFAHKR